MHPIADIPQPLCASIKTLLEVTALKAVAEKDSVRDVLRGHVMPDPTNLSRRQVSLFKYSAIQGAQAYILSHRQEDRAELQITPADVLKRIDHKRRGARCRVSEAETKDSDCIGGAVEYEGDDGGDS